MEILRILVQRNLIQQSDMDEILRASGEEETSIELLLEGKGVSEEEILKAKADAYGIPYKNLNATEISYDTLNLLPEKSIDQFEVLPLSTEEGVFEVGFVHPEDLRARDAVQFLAAKNNMPFKVVAISKKDFDTIRGSYQGLSSEVGKALTDLESELSAEERELSEGIRKTQGSKSGENIENETQATTIIEDAPVTKIVATVLRYATEGGASDVHIEPIGKKVRVRFRIDGVLHTSLVLPQSVHDAVVARIKILSNMKLDEKRKPQDGRFSAHIDDRKIDFRVSTFPAYYGEKVVMRILDSDKGVKSLEDLGLTKKNIELVREAITRPYGMILISGPTGSGKTTTLYSMLNEVDRETKNVLSLEDPVEYNIPGMSQSQIHPEIGYTFANGLRTTLRQDPDVIMVGEIRDKETAALAVQAALTGHLVLSTIHTNNAVGVIPRLIDMGVDPYMIAPTLILAMAQRLVKKLCLDSGEPIPIEGSVKMMIDKEFQGLPEEHRSQIKIPEKVYGVSPGPGCPNGTSGRIAAYEVLRLDKDIEKIILEDPNEISILNEARRKGMLTMKEDALLKAFKGEVPFEEVNKL